MQKQYGPSSFDYSIKDAKLKHRQCQSKAIQRKQKE